MNYTFPTVSSVGKSIVRYFSIINPWIDFIVIVNPNSARRAESTLDTAMNEYWESDFEAYGDIVEHYLRNANIQYEIVYHDPYDESDDYEKAWEAYLDSLYTQAE